MKKAPVTCQDNLFSPSEMPLQLSPELALLATARSMALAERRKTAVAERDRVLKLIASLPLNAICGLDEVGRGPLAGPVTAAAVVLNPDKPIHGLDDSKKLSPAVRAALDPLIRANALGWGLGWVWPEEIESLNIHHASLLAMRRAFAAMVGLPLEKGQPQLVDGNLADTGPGILHAHWRHRLMHGIADGKHPPDLGGMPWEGGVHTLVKGDALCPAISAASIIAKVARDNWMCHYAQLDSRYGFDNHMGYGTPEHWLAIEAHGPCPIHRLSWLARHGENTKRNFSDRDN